jgi:PAS domain S-box-containing protein
MNGKLTDEQIKDWNNKYKELLDSINIGFMLFDPDYTCYDVNDAFLKMVGAKREDYQRLHVENLFPPDEFRQLYELVEPLEMELKEKKAVGEKKYYTFEWFWYHHQTGEKIPMLLTGAVNMNPDGVHESTYITCTDLREQKRIQEDLKREKNKLEAILFGIGDCVTIYDLEENLLFGNPQGMAIHGKRNKPLLKLKIGNRSEIDLKVNDEQRRYEGKIESVSDSEGKIFAYAEILKDITSQLKLEQQEQELSRMKRKMRRLELQTEMIGTSHAMRNIFDLILRCAEVDSTILVLGETGVGKELVARAIHNQSSRGAKPFIAINCGALPETLLESELFGHVKGAFTGAVSERKGLFREAEGGTLFLDEIGDLSRTLQVKLLRVLQEKDVRPVGSSKTYLVDVRVMAATHRNLIDMVKQRNYRRDLYYRLAVIPITIPPLRERRDDILPLAEHFIRKHGKRIPKKLDHSTQRILLSYFWPGNIRELENCIEHALAMSKGRSITTESLPVQVAHPQEQNNNALRTAASSSKNSIEENGNDASAKPENASRLKPGLKPWEIEEKIAIEEALVRHRGNRTRTAKDLGVSRGTLWRKIGFYQVDI